MNLQSPQKIKLLILAFLTSSSTHFFAQDLRNTEWTQVVVERKNENNNSDIIPWEQSITKYYFRDDSVYVAINNLFTEVLPYSVNNRILSIGSFSKYSIDTVDSEVLVLTQIPSSKSKHDQAYRFIFLNRFSLFAYLSENNRVRYIENDLIENSNHLCPTYYGDLAKLFTPDLALLTRDREVAGFFIVNSEGNIEHVESKADDAVSKKVVEVFAEKIKLTNGKWILPETPERYKYKINFEIEFITIQSFEGISFSFVTEFSSPGFVNNLTFSQMIKAGEYLSKGDDLFRNGKYEKAIIQYKKCIDVDSLNMDAYYNMAVCYHKLGKNDLACETWNKLKAFGQKDGEAFYDENCR